MTIEKTYKLTIKDTVFNLTEEEVSALYETCRRALNISITGTKPFDNPIAPMYPTWPTPYVTSKGTDNSVMDSSTSTANVPSSNGINFISDDMRMIIKENNKWRSSVQQALDKLSAKTNVTTSEGIKVG